MIVEILKSFGSSPKRLPPTVAGSASAALAPYNGLVGKGNTHVYRNWSRGSDWVRGAINIRNNQISTAEWDIVPEDPKADYSKRNQAYLRQLFKNPNPEDKTFARFAMKHTEDLLVLDAGCVEKDRSLDGMIRRLWTVDGGTVKVSLRWDGDPKEPRFFWYPDHTEHYRWLNDDFVYMLANPNTLGPLGLSPLETLKITIDALLSGDEYQLRQLKSAAPDGLLDLGEGVNPTQIADFRNYWLAEVAGRGAMAFIGGTKGAKFHPFRASNRDMQFQEWLVWLVRKIAVVYGLSPQDLGLTMDVNRANAEQQAENTEDRGLRPLMSLTQDYYTTDIVQDSCFGGRDNNLAFRFTRLNLKESKSKADINGLALAGAPWKLVDEARQDDGRAPLGGKLGEMLLMKVANGVVSIDPEDIPTAREYLDAMTKKAEPVPAAGDAPPQPGAPDQPQEAT